MKFRLFALIALAFATPCVAQAPKPLFAADDTLQLTIRGPLGGIIRTRSSDPVAGTLSYGGETLPVNLSVRGITRRTTETCDFPPLRVEFTSPPPPTSLFAGQRRLKLVTHCRREASFQQYVLLEYAAYRMFNVLTPASFRVRLANVDYQGEDGRPMVSRVGFFIEDTDDVARRNGLRELHAPARIAVTALSPQHAARYALFQEMIANHDWSMRAGPAGDDCCHNAKLIGSAGLAAGAVIPIPYDFDFSGMVNPPYATPPDQLDISSVRQRMYRGYCSQNREAVAAAAQMRAARPQMLAALAATPGLDGRTRQKAESFLLPFFAEIATDADVASKLLKRCLG
jgi:hypothetical protein